MTPKSIPIPSLFGISVLSTYSIPTHINQSIPSKITCGLIYLQLVGILFFSQSLIQLSFALFFFLDVAIFSNLTCVFVNLIFTLST